MTSIIRCIQSLLGQYKYLNKIIYIVQAKQLFYTDLSRMFAEYMNVWDLGCIMMLVLSGITGYSKGFIMHTGKWIGLAGCAALGLHFITMNDLYHWQAISIYFTFVICTWAVILIALGRMSTLISKSHISFLNKSMGAIGGVLHGILIIFCMFVVARKMKVVPPEILSSYCYQVYNRLFDVMLVKYEFLGYYFT
jgi:uncharacterized membrane protein required for colicin V production